MSNERIDIEAYTQIFEFDDGITDEQLVAFGLSAIAELKRCYQLIDEQQRILHHHQACAECLGHRDELECIVVCECSDGFKEDASE